MASHLMSCSFIKAMRLSLSESSALHASPQPADMTDGRGIVRPGIPHALPLISSFNGAVVVSKVMISRFFFSLTKLLSITPNYNPFNLTEKSNLTTEMAIKMLNGSALQNAAAAYVYAEEVYGVNAIFLISLTSLESGHGRSELAMYRNNIGGVKSSSGDWAYFSDWGECIMYIASFISDLYLNEDGAYYNGKSIWAVNIKYCEDSSPWADMINSIANDLLAKV